mmetsp:Transcript_25623/g.42145  ORF Transcript_25623/g.42145 Transcript_25623/m.42145 type:complete len:414 (-) Transcript_25623:372-1613(-)|eukprot:CAMPEP_0184674088 /NCGR_PEP_ID=MMETSP0308-20130426/87047_1 /TAXON_ID=38269 /ORGANISM="Gloeochaete witrockiana, Strain SAG 46.84" /LENGTH=413 /DNA_ID=CAMNT_0027121659 /DNA_START=29 /DNA_END=1270 /DNA_ORIENTATION=+
MSAKNIVTIPWNKNYQLLQALDPWTRALKPSPFVYAEENVTPELARSKAYIIDAPADQEIPRYSTDVLGATGNVHYFYTVVQSSQEFSDAVSNVANLSGSYGGLSGSLSVDFARNSNQKLFHTHAYVGVFTRDYVVQVPLVYLNQLKLNEDAASLLKPTAGGGGDIEKRLKTFTDVYGDSFIIGYVTGGFFLGDLDYATSSSESQQALKASLQLSYKNAFVSVGLSDQFSKDSKSIEATTSCTVRITSMGYPTDAKLVVTDLPSLLETVGTFSEYNGSAKIAAVLFKFSNLPVVRERLEAETRVLTVNEPSEVVIAFLRSEQYKLEYNLKLLNNLRGPLAALKDYTPADEEEVNTIEDKILGALTAIAGKTPEQVQLPTSIDDWKEFYRNNRKADAIDAQVAKLASRAAGKKG